jgi:eukaryotic-like serine/threonine-protein kinase
MDVAERLAASVGERYQIQREIGSGGMATVYLAEDLKHHRRVAIKVLHPALAAVIGGDRFLREIEIIAGLAHPRILPLHDSGTADGLLFYVMPFVEGESLRERLKREKQLPLDQAVRITCDVASALSFAHGRGVIHRDIKPENILLSGNEAVVADFGIARAVDVAGGKRLTETGLSLGTPQYMSPEQASGDAEPDGRSDIYSLGCVLYEMLAGEPPHTGSTAQAVLAKVLTEAPRDIRAFRETAPASLAMVLQKALSRLPADRFSTASNFADALPPLVSLGLRADAPAESAQREGIGRFLSLRAVWPVVAALALAFAAFQMLGRPGEPSGEIVQFDSPFPPGAEIVGGSPPLAISPDGMSVVFAARQDGATRLFLRRLNESTTMPLPGTEGAHTPFFSPDGRWVGYVGARTIEKVSIAGGSPIRVGSAPFVSLGAAWAPGFIVFGGVGVGLHMISEDGGAATQLTALDATGREISHGWPQVLPDGKRVMFTVGSGEGPRTAVVSLDTEERDWVQGLDGASGARYLPTGHLVFAMARELFSVEFDPRRLRVLGPLKSMVQGIYGGRSGTFGVFTHFAVSRTGTLVYFPGGLGDQDNSLVWVEADGRTTIVSAHSGSHFYPRLAPDGGLIAVQESNEIWIYDPVRGTRNRLTSGGGTDPVWTPDGKRVTFAAGREGLMSLHWMPADGSGEMEPLHARANPLFPHSWSPDGRTLAFYEASPETARDIWVLTVTEAGVEANPFLATPANERSPVFSPDGKWLAYVSDRTGRDEIYVRPYPGPGGEWPISRDGGREPVWARSGTHLYYRQGPDVMSVGVREVGGFSVGEPRKVISGGHQNEFTASGSQTYDVSPDGSRFLFTENLAATPPAGMRVVLNWSRELMAPGGSGRK